MSPDNRIPQVSVLVTVFNRESYLKESLKSILASTFAQFEVIVVDDCSSDDSLAIARAIAAIDSRVRVYANESNLGDYGNRMKAASFARGHYLKYVDSDDLIYPHTLEVMFNAIHGDDSVGLALSHSLAEEQQPYPWVLAPVEVYRKHFLGRGCLSCGPTGAIIRRSAFEAVGGFRKDWRVLSDIDLWLRLAARWSVALLPPGLVWWRRHEGQEFTAATAAQTYLDLGYQLCLDALSSRSCPLEVKARAEAIGKAQQHHARRLLSLATRRARPMTAWRSFQKSGLTLRQLAGGLQPYA